MGGAGAQPVEGFSELLSQAWDRLHASTFTT